MIVLRHSLLMLTVLLGMILLTLTCHRLGAASSEDNKLTRIHAGMDMGEIERIMGRRPDKVIYADPPQDTCVCKWGLDSGKTLWIEAGRPMCVLPPSGSYQVYSARRINVGELP